MKTPQKIRFLEKHLLLIFKQLQKVNPQNIVGFRIDKKKIAGKNSRNYAIIFQVVKKEDLDYLNKKQIIPTYINVEFPDGKTRRIITDVEETGKFNFHVGVGGKVMSKLSPPNTFGTAGLFVTDDGVRTLMVTNYHVVAENLMHKGVYYYRRAQGSKAQNVKLIVTNTNNVIVGRFEEGMIAGDIDVAFVHLPIPINHSEANRLQDGQKVQGRSTVNPIPGSYKGKPVNIFSSSNPGGIPTEINSVSAILHTDDPGVSFVQLLQFSPKVTRGGDSGSIVLTPSYNVLGLIIGADDNYSYAIPFYKVSGFKQFSII